jgi:Cytochrome b(C-terminal)/b6/petD
MLSNEIQNGLGIYYVLVALFVVGFAAYCYRTRQMGATLFWGGVTAVCLIHALAYFTHAGWVLPLPFRAAIDFLMGPVVYTSLSIILFVAMLLLRKIVVQPQVAWGIFILSLLSAGWALTDPSFRAVVTKPDNVPIPLLIYSVGFFTWVAMYRAVQNDERLKRGEPVLEKLDDEKILVWPDLVYTELIAMIVATFVLVVWAVALKAPLEPPATTAKAPNPSKAPWYFLGLQEMLVYFDPWMAGVVLPTMIIIGLVALPYIDFNREGNGYFSFERRWFAMSIFMFGFIVLWVTLIVLGTFLRGPNWNFFGPFEYWDPHKVLPLLNKNVSQFFWLDLFGISPDFFKARYGTVLGVLLREMPGILLVCAYLFLLPPLLARTVMRPFFIRMGFVRFIVLVVLIQFMASLPIKMVLRWTLNLKYIVYIPEIFFNI